MKRSLGSLHQAVNHGSVFTDSRSNDFILSASTLEQRLLFGFSSNFPSSMSLGMSNLVVGSSTSNVDTRIEGKLLITSNAECLQVLTSSNIHVRNVLGVGTTSPNLDYALHVNGDARIEGDLTVNGTITSVNTNVSVTDQLSITNDGTGPAVIANQTGAEPIVIFQDDGIDVFTITDGGDVSIGSNAPLAKLDVQGNTFIRGNLDLSNIVCSNVNASNIQVNSNLTVEHHLTVPNTHTTNIYVQNRFTVDENGVVADPNWIPNLFQFQAKEVIFASSNLHHSTSNATLNTNHLTQTASNADITVQDTIHLDTTNIHVTSCNITLTKYVYLDGHMRIGSSNPVYQDSNNRLRVSKGDATITGVNDFVAPGDQARLYLGNTNHFIAASCNVGIVMQVPGTLYPLVLEEMSGFTGLGMLDPEERLHVKENAKIGSNVFAMNAIAIGHSNPQETLSILGNLSMSNVNSKIILYNSNDNLGINTSEPTAKLHVLHTAGGDAFLVEDSATSDDTPFVIKEDGWVGIGTRQPAYKLDTRGEARFKDVIHVDGTSNVGGAVMILDSNMIAEDSNGFRIDNYPIDGCNCLRIVKVMDGVPVDDINNVILTDYGYLHLSDSNSLPDERLHVNNGNAKFEWDTYIMGYTGMGTSNPTEMLEVTDNVKIGYNLYTMGGVGIGTSNITNAFDIVGDMNIIGNITIVGGSILATAGGAGVWVAEDQDISYGIGNVAVGANDFSEQFTVSGNAKVTGNLYTTQSVGIRTSNPSEALDVVGYAKASSGVRGGVALMRSWNANSNIASFVHSNLEAIPSAFALKQDSNGLTYLNAAKDQSIRFQISNVNFGTFASNGYFGLNTMLPSEFLEVNGNAKITSNLYTNYRVSVANSNPSEAIDVTGNIKVSNALYTMTYLSVANSNPTEAVDISGNAKISNQLYVMERISVANSNPTEQIDVTGNIKVSSNLYTLNSIGVATSNPAEQIHVEGNGKITSNLYVLERYAVAHSNPTETVDILGNAKISSNLYTLHRIGVATSNPSEAMDAEGNVKVSNHLYVLSNIAVAHSNPSEQLDVLGNTKVSSNLYTMVRIGVANSNPTEALDVHGNAKVSLDVWAMDHLGVRTSNPTEVTDIVGNMKVSSNIYSMYRLGVADSNPSETLHVQGTAKITKNVYMLNGVGVATSNLTETVDIRGSMKVSDETYLMTRMGVATSNLSEAADVLGNVKVSSNIYALHRLAIASSNPTETLHVHGTAKVTSNAYVMERLGVATSNPSEYLEVQGNGKISSNMYVMSRLGVNTSNPNYTLEVNGNTNFTGIMYNNGIEYPMSRWSSNYTTSNIWFMNGRVTIGSNTHDERFNVLYGNAKFGSNIYVNDRIGVGLSNPEQSIHAVGNVQAANGTLGPMIMLIPPIAFADISVGSRLALDNTVEAGNEASSLVYRSLFCSGDFLTQDKSTDNMRWKEARFIFRGMALTNVEPEETTMVVQDFHWNRSPQYVSITNEFVITTNNMERGYTTNATPWFSCSTEDVRHLAIRVVTSTTINAVYRFGSIYMQFR